MKLAIMQPYFLPYLGYFQLIAAVDQFVFLDDVNFINRGWINRNQIALGGSKHLFTIPLVGASQNRAIREIAVEPDEKWRRKLLRTMEQAYRRAPYYEQIMPGVNSLLQTRNITIGELAKASIRWVCDLLGVTTTIVDSSGVFENSHLKGAERIRDICLRAEAAEYVNPPGGRELYEPTYFAARNIQLSFLEPHLPEYRQSGTEFLPGLSIVDILMNNSVEVVQAMARQGLVIPARDRTPNPAAVATPSADREAH